MAASQNDLSLPTDGAIECVSSPTAKMSNDALPVPPAARSKRLTTSTARAAAALHYVPSVSSIGGDDNSPSQHSRKQEAESGEAAGLDGVVLEAQTPASTAVFDEVNLKEEDKVKSSFKCPGIKCAIL